MDSEKGNFQKTDLIVLRKAGEMKPYLDFLDYHTMRDNTEMRSSEFYKELIGPFYNNNRNLEAMQNKKGKLIPRKLELIAEGLQPFILSEDPSINILDIEIGDPKERFFHLLIDEAVQQNQKNKLEPKVELLLRQLILKAVLDGFYANSNPETTYAQRCSAANEALIKFIDPVKLLAVDEWGIPTIAEFCRELHRAFLEASKKQNFPASPKNELTNKLSENEVIVDLTKWGRPELPATVVNIIKKNDLRSTPTERRVITNSDELSRKLATLTGNFE